MKRLGWNKPGTLPLYHDWPHGPGVKALRYRFTGYMGDKVAVGVWLSEPEAVDNGQEAGES